MCPFTYAFDVLLEGRLVFSMVRKNRKYVNEPIQEEAIIEEKLRLHPRSNPSFDSPKNPLLVWGCHVFAPRDFPSTMCCPDIGDSFMFTPLPVNKEDL